MNLELDDLNEFSLNVQADNPWIQMLLRKYISLIVNEFPTISNLNWLNYKSYLRLFFSWWSNNFNRFYPQGFVSAVRSYITLTRRTFG